MDTKATVPTFKQKSENVAQATGYGIFLGSFLGGVLAFCGSLLSYLSGGMWVLALFLGLPLMAFNGAIIGGYFGLISGLFGQSERAPDTTWRNYVLPPACGFAAMILIYAALFLLP